MKKEPDKRAERSRDVVFPRRALRPETVIIESTELASEHPHCVLPKHFFERALHFASRAGIVVESDRTR